MGLFDTFQTMLGDAASDAANTVGSTMSELGENVVPDLQEQVSNAKESVSGIAEQTGIDDIARNLLQ